MLERYAGESRFCSDWSVALPAYHPHTRRIMRCPLGSWSVLCSLGLLQMGHGWAGVAAPSSRAHAGGSVGARPGEPVSCGCVSVHGLAPPAPPSPSSALCAASVGAPSPLLGFCSCSVHGTRSCSVVRVRRQTGRRGRAGHCGLVASSRRAAARVEDGTEGWDLLPVPKTRHRLRI